MKEYIESEALELKKSTSELKEAIISIAAMLNKHQKGKLYFGIANNGNVIGQTVTENTLREVSRAISDNIEPKIYPEVRKENMENKDCVAVEFKGTHTPYFAYGRAYMRVADEDRQISAIELEKIFVEKNREILRWENQLCKEATLQDIDTHTVKKFIEFVRQSKRLGIEKENTLLVLKKLELIRDNKLTNAAVLLFGKQPSTFFPNATLKCGRFRDVTKSEFIDMKDFDGNLFCCLEKSMIFFMDHLRLSARIEGLLRKEKWEIPTEALREAVINALIHRDYFSSGYSYIKIYDSTIVIANPGKLPESIKINDLYKEHESKPNNPLLAKVFYYTGYIDAWGRGILNIIKSLQEQNLEKVQFEESGGSFRIVFKRPKISEGLGSTLSGTLSGTLNDVMIFVKENPGIQANQISKRLERPIDTVKKQVKTLVDKGLVVRKGSRKTGGYYVKQSQ